MPRWEIETEKETMYFDDIFNTNNYLKENKPIRLTFYIKDICVKVDMRDGTIEINGNKHIYDYKPETKFRWVNFRRVKYQVSLVSAPTILETIYFVGWQTTINGKNIKKMVKITDSGDYIIVDRS